MSTTSKVKLVLNFASKELAEELESNDFDVTNTSSGLFSVNYDKEPQYRIVELKSIVRKHSPSAEAYIYNRA